KYGSTRPEEDLDFILYGNLKTMFEPHVEDTVWRNPQGYQLLDWKLYDTFKTAGEVTTVSTKLLLLEEVTTARGSYYC
ncbi:hypothetical protein Tco_1479168, partial [Tanacetum coccineum]